MGAPAFKLTRPQRRSGGAKKKTGRAAKLAAFSIPRAFEVADEIMAGPCASRFVPRTEPRGTLVYRFALPADLVRSNASRHGMQFAHGAHKANVFKFLEKQCRSRPGNPLPGRPMVRCIRFSPQEPDARNDGFKVAVDVLCVPKLRRDKRGVPRLQKNRLGIIVDDKPSSADIQEHWEKCRPGETMGIIEIWNGGEQ